MFSMCTASKVSYYDLFPHCQTCLNFLRSLPKGQRVSPKLSKNVMWRKLSLLHLWPHLAAKKLSPFYSCSQYVIKGYIQKKNDLKIDQ